MKESPKGVIRTYRLLARVSFHLYSNSCPAKAFLVLWSCIESIPVHAFDTDFALRIGFIDSLTPGCFLRHITRGNYCHPRMQVMAPLVQE